MSSRKVYRAPCERGSEIVQQQLSTLSQRWRFVQRRRIFRITFHSVITFVFSHYTSTHHCAHTRTTFVFTLHPLWRPRWRGHLAQTSKSPPYRYIQVIQHGDLVTHLGYVCSGSQHSLTRRTTSTLSRPLITAKQPAIRTHRGTFDVERPFISTMISMPTFI